MTDARLGRLTSLAAAFLVAVALVVAARQLPRSIQTAHERVRANAGLSRLQRELAPARFWGMNERLLLRADRTLPRDAVYAVAVGRKQASRGVPLFYPYWLLPRRHVKDPAKAQWIVLWGADRSTLGVNTAVVADLGADGQILRVRR